MKHLYALMLLVGLTFAVTVGSYQSADAQTTKDGVTLAQLDKKEVFTGTEKSLPDSLQAIANELTDPVLIETIQNAIDIAKNPPQKDSSATDWLNWISLLIASIASALTLLISKIVSAIKKAKGAG